MSTFLIGIALKSTAVLGCAWIIALCLGRKSAALRHLVWIGAFVAVSLLPLLSVSLPSVRVPLAGRFVSPAVVFKTAALASEFSTRSPQAAAPESSASVPSHVDWPLCLTLLCAAGAAAGMARMTAGWFRVARLRRNSRILVIPELASLIEMLGINRAVPVLESPGGSMPLTFGVLNPVIFLPAGAEQWSGERRRMVLLHELAHVQRRDTLTHLFARAVLSMYWWNPLALAAWRRFLKERERAADDLVLTSGAQPSRYAAHLLEIARSMSSLSLVSSAGVAMARPSQLEGRLLAILDGSTNRTAPGRASIALAAALALILIAPLAALQAQESSAAAPADVDAAIRAARSQSNFEMLDEAARAAVRLRHSETARKLLEASLAVRGEVKGQQSAEYGVGLINLADDEQRTGESAAARALYDQAATLLGNRKEAAPALTRLGIATLANKEPERALQLFTQAKLADPSKAGIAAMWTAVARERQGNLAEAEVSFKEALSLAKPDSPEAATVLELYAKFLRGANREAEATESAARATSIRNALGTRAVPGPHVYKMSSGIERPQLLEKAEPEYTDEARAAGYQGTVVLSVEIGTDGLAHNFSIVRGLGLGLDEKAVDAVTRWKFKPGAKDGQPVTVLAQIEVNYRLQ